MTSIRQALQKAAACLKALPHSAPELEAAMLLCHLLGKPSSFLYAWSEHQLSEAQWQAYQGLLERRVGGEPVAHITGLREFWSLGLKITPATLIPRPETELLVERALHHLVCSPASLVADLGTGSGAIALAIASECPVCEVHATDRSAAALAVARPANPCLRTYTGTSGSDRPPTGITTMICIRPNGESGDSSAQVENRFFGRTPDGYFLEVRGRNGEVKPEKATPLHSKWHASEGSTD